MKSYFVTYHHEMTQTAHLENRVTNLQFKLHETMRNLATVQDELNSAIRDLQANCKHEVYEYERDSDGHKTIHTYTCKKCKHWTYYRPENATIL